MANKKTLALTEKQYREIIDTIESLKEDISDLFVSQFDTAPTVSINQKFIKIDF